MKPQIIKSLLILTLLLNPAFASDPCLKKLDLWAEYYDNQISLKGLNTEKSKMTFHGKEISLIGFLDLVFDGINGFKKGQRKDDPKIFCSEMKRGIASLEEAL